MSQARWWNDDEAAEPQRFDWADLVVVGTTFALRVARATSGLASHLDALARSHANYRRDRAEFKVDIEDSIKGLK